MKRYNFAGLIIFSLVVCSFPASANSNVDYVYDGDTITLTNRDKVRLVQIDTPELSPAECYGKEARDLLKQLIGNSIIRLTREPSAGNRDDFGRLLRYVNVSSTNINLELVKRGAATPWF
jgi:micrococcal nuclease